MSLSSGSNLANRQPSFSHALMNYKTCLKCNNNFQNYNVSFAGCQHDFRLCKGCYCQYIDEKMSASQILSCPFCPKEMLLQSKEFLTVFETLSWSHKKEVKQYTVIFKRTQQLWICRINGCGGKIPNQICQKCATHYCPKCKQKYHPLDACPISVKTAASSNPQLKNILKCEKCDYENKIKEKDLKKKVKKCGNAYCNAYLCLEHWTLWNQNHDQYHQEFERIYHKKIVGCNSCELY